MTLSKRQFLSYSALLGLGAYLPLNTFAATNTFLESSINNAVKEMRKNGLVAPDERTAWAVTDLRSKQKLVSINEDVPLQTASMVKPLVIQAYLMTHYRKDPVMYPLSERVTSEMQGMIVKSNNEFTNHIIKRLGGPQGVQWMLKKEAPNIFRNISIVEYIPDKGQTYLNRASAGDYDRFLQALWHEQLPGSAFLKNLMRIANHDRIRTKTQYVPQSASVYDKTGSTAMLCGNTGIIELYDHAGTPTPYTITGIIEKSARTEHYTRWITNRSNVIRAVSDIVYLHFAKTYQLS